MPFAIVSEILKSSKWEIKEKNESNSVSTYKINVNAPDMATIFEQSDITELEKSEAYVCSNLSKYRKDFIFEIDVIKTDDGNWRIQSCKDSLNAMTGGLIEYYEALQQNTIDALSEGK